MPSYLSQFLSLSNVSISQFSISNFLSLRSRLSSPTARFHPTFYRSHSQIQPLTPAHSLLLPPFLPRSLVQGGSILLPMIGPPSPPSVLRSGAYMPGRPDHPIATFWEGGADYNRPRSGAAAAYSGPSSPPHTFILGTTSLWID